LEALVHLEFACVDELRAAGLHPGAADPFGDLAAADDRVKDLGVEAVDLQAQFLDFRLGERIVGAGGVGVHASIIPPALRAGCRTRWVDWWDDDELRADHRALLLCPGRHKPAAGRRRDAPRRATDDRGRG